MSPNLEIPYFLDADADRRRGRQPEDSRVSRQDGRREIDAVAVVVGGGTNVVPNHHHGHGPGRGLPPVWFRVGTVRPASEVVPRA